VSSASTEFKVGATILLAGVLLVGGIAWLKESSIHGKMRIWTVAFPTAGGLSSSDEVQVNGIRNGQVRSMRLVGDRVISEIELSKEIPLTRNSVVSIRNVGMMGEKVIAVTLGSGGGMYSVHDTIPGVYEPGLDEAMGQISTTVETISGLATDLRGVTSSLNRNGRLDAAIDDFRKTSEELRSTVAENRALMHETLMNLSATSKTAKALTADREPQLRRTVDDFSSAATKLDQLSGRLDSLRAVMQSLATQVDSGQGTLGRLMKDEKLYDELSTSVATLRTLVADIQKNPKKYFHFSVF
jgi:phospholipid/cholesterol/gamma-HCH transport system substrate-binding protein